jgi:hypothetical protein
MHEQYLMKGKANLTYAVSRTDGKLKHISEVANGKACDCICPSPHCEEPLIARNKGKKNADCFAHESGTECDNALESALHLLAKQVFNEIRAIKTPFFKKGKYFKIGKHLNFDTVEIEVTRGKAENIIRADAVGIINGKELLVEFAKTHSVDERKKEKIISLGLACIEIDLRELPLDKEEIKGSFLSGLENMTWISNPRLEKDYQTFIKLEGERQAEMARNQNLKREEEYKRQLDTERREREIYFNAIKSYEVQPIQMLSGFGIKCPLYKEILQEFVASKHFKKSIVYRIMNGDLWDMKILGREPYESYAYITGSKVLVYPSKKEKQSFSETEMGFWNFQYRSLKTLQKAMKEGSVGRCYNCSYKKQILKVDGKTYALCKYKEK